MAIRRPKKANLPCSPMLAIVRLWVLRILIPMEGYKAFVAGHGFRSDELARALGLERWLDQEDLPIDRKKIRLELEALHLQAEQELANEWGPQLLRDNLAKLSTQVGLSEVDERILEFAVLLHSERQLLEACECLGELTAGSVMRSVAGILAMSEQEVARALHPRGLLAQAGLLKLDGTSRYSLELKLEMLSTGFAETISASAVSVTDLLRETVLASSPPELTLADYSYLGEPLTTLQIYLDKVAKAQREGVNIFLYGPPGTGKSQLVKALAAELGCMLYEITSEDEDGDPLNGEQRLRALRAAQCLFFKQPKTLLVFDESEDVFGEGIRFHRSVAQESKAWVNRALENNPIPTLWLSNSTEGLDSAFLRRFDMILEMPVPSKEVRGRIIHAACSGLLDARAASRFAESKDLAPALVARSASVVRSLKDELGKEKAAGVLERLVNNTLKVQGHRTISRFDPNSLPEVYDPAFIQCDVDVNKVVEGLMHARSGRLCLYGPPGTGKTAFGRWIAQRLDAPLHVHRVSDLVSMWVGKTEQNLAEAFQRAEQEGAVLLIDEVDSFLQDRRNAQRSWEVTEVNEMLTQMESFAGVFVASTNLMDGLDQAAMRRFDLKAKFQYLKPEQAWQLFAKQCAALGLEAADASEVVIRQLQVLTPGDFAAVVRQSRFNPMETAADFAKGLVAECAVKEGYNHSRIGFC